MKLPPSLLHTYRDVHSWLGITTSLLLFVAFFAGGISVFEAPLRTLTTPPSNMPAPPTLEETPHLLELAFQQNPKLQKNYSIIVHPDTAQPARLIWPDPTSHAHGHKKGRFMMAALSPDGHLIISRSPAAPTASFIEHLHETLGLPLPQPVGRIVTGLVALLYTVALVSGVIAFLPALVRTLFAVRLNSRARQLWGDIHNVIGFCSLPFHIVIGITAAAFCFHNTIFALQKELFSPPPSVSSHHTGHTPHAHSSHSPNIQKPLPPSALIASIHQHIPGFEPEALMYQAAPNGRMTVRVMGADTRYSSRGPTGGFAVMNPYDGTILSSQYLPGHQERGFAIITLFFSLHFGSFGGMLTRVGYLILGFGGAFLFYTGNKLWLNSRRRREKGRGLSRDTFATYCMDRLTLGWVAGCMSGITALILVGSITPQWMREGTPALLYYSIFLLSILLSFLGPHVAKHARLYGKKITGNAS